MCKDRQGESLEVQLEAQEGRLDSAADLYRST